MNSFQRRVQALSRSCSSFHMLASIHTVQHNYQPVGSILYAMGIQVSCPKMNPPSGSSSPQQSTPEYHRPESTYHDEPFDHDQQDSDDLDEEEKDLSESRRIEPKKGGYHSRIEQILYENPDLDIQIVHAGKNTEGGGSYITYTIRTGVRHGNFVPHAQILTLVGHRSTKTL